MTFKDLEDWQKELVVKNLKDGENIYIEYTKDDIIAGLKKENQELKKQLENTDYTSVYLKVCEDTKDKYESQQKEFIEYLNRMFNYYQKEEQKYRTLSNRAMKVAFESVLEKYKEIIGGDNK